MADTAKSVASLQTLFADNADGDISPQDLRDFLVTALGVYGSISTFEAATQQADVGTAGTLLTCFSANGASSSTTPDHTNDRITVTIPGVYEVNFFVCFEGTNGAEFRFRLRKNAVEQSYGTSRVGSGAGNYGSASFGAQLSLAANDILTIYVESDTSTDDITVSEAQLMVRLIG